MQNNRWWEITTKWHISSTTKCKTTTKRWETKRCKVSAKLGVLIIRPWLKAMWSYEYQICIDIISYYQIASFGVHSLNWMNNVAINNVQFIVAMNPGVGWESQHICHLFSQMCPPSLSLCPVCFKPAPGFIFFGRDLNTVWYSSSITPRADVITFPRKHDSAVKQSTSWLAVQISSWMLQRLNEFFVWTQCFSVFSEWSCRVRDAVFLRLVTRRQLKLIFTCCLCFTESCCYVWGEGSFKL